MRNAIYLFLLYIISCSKVDKQEVSSVRAVALGIIEADNRSDIEKVLSFYHPEAVLFPPGKSPITGLEAVRKNYLDIFSSSKLQLSMTIDEARVIGDWGFVSGKNSGSRILLMDQSAQSIESSFVIVMEKYEGEWKIRKLWWN